MLPWLRWTLVITELILAASLLRRRSSPWIWGYFLVSAYSAIDYHPFVNSWWVQHWIWLEMPRMMLRLAVTMRLFREQSAASLGEHRAIGWAATFVGLAICLLYRFTVGAGILQSFMMIRTYVLLFLWSAWLSALISWWRMRVPLLYGGWFWLAAMSSYAWSALIDWNIHMRRGWVLNTNAWSCVLSGACLLWAIENQLNDDKDHIGYRPLYSERDCPPE